MEGSNRERQPSLLPSTRLHTNTITHTTENHKSLPRIRNLINFYIFFIPHKIHIYQFILIDEILLPYVYEFIHVFKKKTYVFSTLQVRSEDLFLCGGWTKKNHPQSDFLGSFSPKGCDVQ